MAEDGDLDGDGDAEEECECVAQFLCSLHDRDDPGSGIRNVIETILSSVE